MTSPTPSPARHPAASSSVSYPPISSPLEQQDRDDEEQILLGAAGDGLFDGGRSSSPKNLADRILRERLLPAVRDFVASARPLNRDTLTTHYLPRWGAAHYHVLALSVLNPKLVRNLNASVGIRTDLTNLYLAASVAGFSLHHYSRPHVADRFTKQERAFYALYFSALGVLGSVLAWSIGARVLPSNPLFRIVAALASSTAMVRIQASYLDRLDAGC